MSLLLLKKKIQEEIYWAEEAAKQKRTGDVYHEYGKGLKKAISLIDELEKEELYTKNDIEREQFLQLARRMGEPVWSGRSEKEIRERMKMWQDKFNTQGEDSWALLGYIGELEWVLSKDTKE